MSTDDRKVNLSSSVDPSGAREGIQQIKQELGTLPGAAQQAAQATSAPLDKMGTDADKAAKKVEASTRSLVSQIQRQDAALASGGKNTAAYFETIAKQRGVDTAVLTPYLNQLRETERAQLAANKALDGTGMSAKATAAALRQVPAQFTDIVTALASGQQPLTVFLQQGGQLKDAFGGAGNAARALGGYVVGLINPLTLTAAAAAGLALAFYQGSQELPAFQRQLILSGQAAGVTAGQLSSVAKAVAELSGATRGRSAEVLVDIASSAGIGAENLTRFTAAAIQFERAGGDAAETTAKAFKDLAKDPLEAALKLNATTNFLTKSTYEQIKALTDQGKTAEAARIAQEAYYQSVNEKIPKLEASLGLLERTWRGVKDTAKGAWDAMLDIGRSDPDAALNKARERLALLQGISGTPNAGGPSFNPLSGMFGDLTESARQQVQLLEDQKRSEEDIARQKAEQAKQAELLAQYQKEGNQYLSLAEQTQRSLNQAWNEGLAAGEDFVAVVDRMLAISERADQRLYLDQIAAAETQRTEQIKRSIIEINALRAAGSINEYESVTRIGKAEQAAMEVEKTALKQQLGYAAQRTNSEKEVSQLKTQIAAISERQLTREKQLQTDLLALQNARKTALLQFYEAEAAQNRADADAYERSQFNSRAELEKLQLSNADAIKEESDLIRLQTALMGSAEDVRARAIAQYKAELDLKRQIRAIDETDLPGGEAEREEKRAIARQQAAQAMINAQQRATVESWQRTTDQIYDSLTDALLRGFESGKSFAENFRDTLKNMFSTLVLRPVVQYALSPLTSGFASLFGMGNAAGATGAAAGSGAGGGLFGSLGNLGSLAQLGGQFSSLGNTFGLGAQLTGWTGSGTGMALEGAGSMIANGSITQGFAQGAGALAPWAMGAGAGIYGGRAISGGYSAIGGSGNAAVNIGTAIGAIWGPLGAAIGGAIGGVVNRAFGRGPKKVEESGIEGTFNSGELSGGRTYSQWRQKGGWFRSDKTGTDYGALDATTSSALGDAASAMYASTMEWAKTLGLPAEELAKVTTNFKTKLTGDTEKDQAAITELLNTYQAALTGKFSAALVPFQKAGEDLTVTLQRLVVVENFGQAINELGGIFTKVAHSSVDAKEGLLALVGGADNFIQMANGYVSNFYNRDEIAGLKASSIKDALASVGITQDFSGDSAKAQFRALVDQTDVNSADGQKRLATLLGIQGDFSNLAAYLSETGKSLQDVAGQAPAFDALAPLLASGTTQQVGAINEVRDAIVSLEQTVRETAGGSTSSTGPTKGWTEVGMAP